VTRYNVAANVFTLQQRDQGGGKDSAKFLDYLAKQSDAIVRLALEELFDSAGPR